MADEKMLSQRLFDQLVELRNIGDREAIVIEQLIDGRFAISTRRGDALSEIELREELAKTNSRANIIDDLVRRVKEEDWVKVNMLRVARLPSGLSLWFSENGEVYTVPPRVGVTEIQDTLTQVTEWARGSPHPHPEMVGLWLDAFEDQYPYLSPAMPQRQGREVGRESVRQIVQNLMAWSRRGSN